MTDPIDPPRGRLLWKVLAVNLPSVGIVLLGVWLAIDVLSADYFSVLMRKYGISPTESHRMFVDSIHRYLLWVSLAAVGVAGTLSVVLTRRVLRPLSEMTTVLDRVAAGDYRARVSTAPRDELGQLAAAFNRMADSLAEGERLRRQLVADVAHELRTPLTNMRGYLEALRDGVLPPSADNFELLHSETLRLAGLVENLLQLARADGARAYLQKDPLSPAELIEQAAAVHAPAWSAKKITIGFKLDSAPPQVPADRNRLAQVLHNLFENAAQHTPADGRILISATTDGRTLRVSVCNTGEPIPDQDLPHIFDRFFRVDRSRSRDQGGGAGIGLAIVKEIVEAHGGSVGASSTPLETCIWFTLPI